MEQRDTIRFLADLTVNCRVPASPTSGTISDISTSGCRLGIRSGVAIPGGTILLELLPGFHAIGQVIWKTETEVGIISSKDWTRLWSITYEMAENGESDWGGTLTTPAPGPHNDRSRTSGMSLPV